MKQKSKIWYIHILLIIASSLLAFFLFFQYESKTHYEKGIEQALISARIWVNQLNISRVYYSDRVVTKLKENSFKTGADYENHPDMFPNPATQTLEQCVLASQQTDTIASCDLFSSYPFPTDTKRNDLDEGFENRSLVKFVDEGYKEYYEVSKIGDQPVLHFASRLDMEQSCVDCHNNHPYSLKTDWRVGQPRGGVHAILPLTVENKKDFGTIIYILIGCVSFLILGLYFVKKQLVEASLESVHWYKEATEDKDTGLQKKSIFDKIFRDIFFGQNTDFYYELIAIKINNANELSHFYDKEYLSALLKIFNKMLSKTIINNNKLVCAKYSEDTVILLKEHNKREPITLGQLEECYNKIVKHLDDDEVDFQISAMKFSPSISMSCQQTVDIVLKPVKADPAISLVE